MDPQPSESPRKPLVSVEFQTEVDVASGSREHRMFIKMYFEARESGLLAAIPGELWKMLCCLATYMDENGNCYPTQERIARDLGIRRQRVNERIQDLLNFRFNGQPVLSLHRKTRVRGRWNNNVYRIQPVSALKIFDKGRCCAAGADEDRVASLVEEILKTCGDTHSRRFYRVVAKRAPLELIFAALSETKYQARLGKIRKSRGAFFTGELMRLLRERGIDLRFPDPPRGI